MALYSLVAQKCARGPFESTSPIDITITPYQIRSTTNTNLQALKVRNHRANRSQRFRTSFVPSSVDLVSSSPEPQNLTLPKHTLSPNNSLWEYWQTNKLALATLTRLKGVLKIGRQSFPRNSDCRPLQTINHQKRRGSQFRGSRILSRQRSSVCVANTSDGAEQKVLTRLLDGGDRRLWFYTEGIEGHSSESQFLS